MKKKRFSVEHIVGVLKQAEVGVPVVEVIRKAGISCAVEATKWLSPAHNTIILSDLMST